MSDFTIKEMLTLQKELQDKYKDKWEAFNICKCWSYYNDTHN